MIISILFSATLLIEIMVFVFIEQFHKSERSIFSRCSDGGDFNRILVDIVAVFNRIGKERKLIAFGITFLFAALFVITLKRD